MHQHFRFIFGLLLLFPFLTFAQPCEFDCRGKCTAYGVTEPFCFKSCLDAESACKKTLPVITPVVKIVAQNLEWAFVLAPVNALSLLTINYIVQGSDGSKITYPIDIPKAPAPATGVIRDISVDCLYKTAPGGTSMFIAVSATKPSWFDSVTRGDEARTSAANANCAARDGSTLVSQANIAIDAKFASDDYTLFGRPAASMHTAALQASQKPAKPLTVAPKEVTFYGVLSESGSNFVLKFIDPIADRSIELPKAFAKAEATKVQIVLPGTKDPVGIFKITLPAGTKVTLRESGAAASALVSLARLQPMLIGSQPGSVSSQPSITSLSSYPGDLACAAAKSTYIYWQVYSLVKLAKDHGLIRNDKQCNDKNYIATVVAAMIGGGDPIIELLTGVYGGCICFDLF